MALMALLYQMGIIQRVVKLFARLFVHTLGTSGAESLGVAGNIFVGVESAGVVRLFSAGHDPLRAFSTAYRVNGHGGRYCFRLVRRNVASVFPQYRRSFDQRLDHLRPGGHCGGQAHGAGNGRAVHRRARPLTRP